MPRDLGYIAWTLLSISPLPISPIAPPGSRCSSPETNPSRRRVSSIPVAPVRPRRPFLALCLPRIAKHPPDPFSPIALRRNSTGASSPEFTAALFVSVRAAPPIQASPTSSSASIVFAVSSCASPCPPRVPASPASSTSISGHRSCSAPPFSDEDAGEKPPPSLSAVRSRSEGLV